MHGNVRRRLVVSSRTRSHCHCLYVKSRQMAHQQAPSAVDPGFEAPSDGIKSKLIAKVV